MWGRCMVVANRQHVAKVPGQVAAFDRMLSAWNANSSLSKANLVVVGMDVADAGLK